MIQLPTDVLQCILFSCSNYLHVAQFRLVCREFASIIDDNDRKIRSSDAMDIDEADGLRYRIGDIYNKLLCISMPHEVHRRRIIVDHGKVPHVNNPSFFKLCIGRQQEPIVLRYRIGDHVKFTVDSTTGSHLCEFSDSIMRASDKTMSRGHMKQRQGNVLFCKITKHTVVKDVEDNEVMLQELFPMARVSVPSIAFISLRICPFDVHLDKLFLLSPIEYNGFYQPSDMSI